MLTPFLQDDVTMPDAPTSDTPNSAQRCILVIDDDPAILQLVKIKLESAGYEVLTANSGVAALGVIDRKGMPHLAIVDINMPLMNGFDFCETVQQFSDLPVIMLSAQDEEDTIIKSISRYAEDYVTKPFSPRELVARVERVLRRIGDYGYTLGVTTTIDDRLTVDFAHQSALVAGRTVFLTHTENKLLYLLIRNAGHTITTDFLLRRLWPMEEMFEDTLRVHVHRLRQKIEPIPSQPRYIITERGIGYSFPKAKPQRPTDSLSSS
jgi:DNA-binding response OmpR family regulator